MTKEKYLNIQTEFIDLFDENWEDEIYQIDIYSELDKIEFEEATQLRDYFISNSNRQMIKNYIISLANQINLYSVNILKLRKWNIVFEKNNESNKKNFILQDRIIPLSTLLLLEPNTIKNRMIFFYLTILDEKFELVDILSHYNFKDLNKLKYLDKASKYNYDLKKAIDVLQSLNSGKTKQFRDDYTHKIAPNIGMGYFSEFKIISKGSKSAVGFVSHPPIEIEEIMSIAETELRNSISAFNELICFLKLI